MMQMFSVRLIHIVVVSGCCLALLCCLTARGLAAQQDPIAALLEKEEQAFQEAVATISTSVVRIETVGGRDVVQSQLTSTAASTGVVVGPDGYVITSSYHFLSAPTSIIVQLSDGRRFPATQVARDEVLMVTLLKIEANGLIVPPAAEKDEIRVGQWALALGKTYSSEIPNLSVGIVSALDRVWGKAIVQTDAKISPVNYGGPLVDINGRVIGILAPMSPQDSDIQSGTDWYDSGIGFAVSYTRILENLETMKSGQSLKRGLLGVVIAEGDGLGSPAAVEQVRFGSPAEEGNIAEGDVIVRVDDRPIETKTDFKFAMGPRYAGETVELTIKSGAETRVFNATLVEELQPYETGYIGILAEHKPADDTSEGIVIRHVFADSPAAAAGLKQGDRVLQFNEEPIKSSNQFKGLIGSRIVATEVDLVVMQDGANKQIPLTLASRIESPIPEELEPTPIPALEADQRPGELPERGRISENLEELKHRYWAYVPDDYNPNYAYGLLVWIHPAGQPLEAQTLNGLREHCDARGIILLAPLANEEEGWSNEEFEFINELMQIFRDRYTIDPWRTVVFSSGDSSRFAAQFVFRHSDQIAGLAVINSLLITAPPDPEPGRILSFFFGASSDFARMPQLEQIVQKLKTLKHEALLKTSDNDGKDQIPADIFSRLAVWIDSLNRI